LAILTLLSAFSICTVGAFLAIFPIFLGPVGIFWGTPVIYLADFGATLPIFAHFWADFLNLFFTEKSKPPEKQGGWLCGNVWQDLL